MRKTSWVVAALLASSVARADDPNAGGSNAPTIAMAGIGVTALSYGSIQTFMMLDDDLKKGYSGPEHTVPSAFLAGASLLASTALAVTGYQNNDRLSFVGGTIAAAAAAFMTLVVIVSVHEWAIRQGPQHD